MKVVTAKEMQRIDRITIDEIGIPGEVLMGYAGKSIAEYIIKNFQSCQTVAIFSGTGNNGGDGFVIAYFLNNYGLNIDIYTTGGIEKVSKTSNIYLQACKNSNINIIELNENRLKKVDLKKYDLITDAMLGTGFEGTTRGLVKDVIKKINKRDISVLSVDLPSGLPSDGEAPDGEVVMADYTVTIGLPKISLVTHPGKKYAGNLVVTDIGFPRALSNSDYLKIDLLDKDYVKKNLNLLKDIDSHKGAAGHLLLIGGFDNMEGAIMMAAMAALEMGVGLATLLTTNRARNIIAGKIPELITRTLNSFDTDKYLLSNTNLEIHDEQKVIIENELKIFFDEDRHYNAVIIGPGMGRSEISAVIFANLVDNIKQYGIEKILIDGDGLYHLSNYIKNKKLPGDLSLIISPHFSEASRLSGKPISEIKKNRLLCATELAEKISAVTLLKGPLTIVSDGKNTVINSSGNSALATAGSGDVLSGIIGSMMLMDISILDAAGIGAFIHGLAADIIIEESSTPVLKATDLVKYIKKAIVNIFE